MNELIASIIDRKTIIFANEGRLLKKCFLAIIILTLAFQQGALGEVVRASMVDAYLQVSVFVGFTLFIFIGLDSPVIKSHGGTDFIGFSNSLSVCTRTVTGNLIEKIRNNIR